MDDFSSLEKDVLRKAIAAEDKAVNVDKLDQKKAFDKISERLGLKDSASKGGGGGVPSDKMDKMKKMNYKKGGSVSSASKRADGCCIRGKTRA
jgi:hypothetical protein